MLRLYEAALEGNCRRTDIKRDVDIHDGFPNNCNRILTRGHQSTRYDTVQDASQHPLPLPWDLSSWIKSILAYTMDETDTDT
jgi:hypothetical protein